MTALLAGVVISSVRIWKSYLLVLVYAGGLLVMVMYFASLTKSSEAASRPLLRLPLIGLLIGGGGVRGMMSSAVLTSLLN
jgi:hypothetical protein